MLKTRNLENLVFSLEQILGETVNNNVQSGEDGQKLMADLLFQVMEITTGYLDVEVIDIDKYRSSGGSPHSARMPSASRKVASILGKVDDIHYYYRHQTSTKDGKLCVHHVGYYSHLDRPRTKVIARDAISVELARTLAEEIIKKLKMIAKSSKDIIVYPHEDFVIRYFQPYTDKEGGMLRFTLVKSSSTVTNPDQAIAAFSLRQKGDAAQKRLQQIRDIMIYAGQWISVAKNLSKEVSVMDSKIAGITPTELGVNEQSESATV